MRNREIHSAMSVRMQSEWGYRPDSKEVEEEVDLLRSSIIKGLKSGKFITFVNPEKLRMYQHSDVVTYSLTKGASDREISQLAEDILKKSLNQWRDSSLELAYILEKPGSNTAKIEFPLRPDLK